MVVLQSSEVGDETVAEAADEDNKAECVEVEVGSPAASGGSDCMSPASSSDTAVATCSEQLLVCGSSDLIADNAAASGEMCLPVQALVKRGKKSEREDQAARYPSITGTLSERCVQSVEHIVQVFAFVAFSCCILTIVMESES